MTSTNRLDHTVINVRFDMDDAEILFGQLGFTLTPRGYHSHGSINHLMMFETDYLELLGLPAGEPPRRKDIRDAPVGINGLVFKTDNVDEVFAHLQSLGFDGEPPKAFHRPVEMDGESRDAKFRTVTARGDVFPAGRVYFCEHGTPELVWRPEWQTHANGVFAILEFVSVARDAGGEAANFAKLLGTEVRTDTTGGRYSDVGEARITTLTMDQYEDRYGALASIMDERNSIFGALVFLTRDQDALNDLLDEVPAGLGVEIHDGRTVVRANEFDAVMEFVAAD